MQGNAASMLLVVLAGCATPVDPHQLGSLFRRHDDHAVQVAALVVDLDTGETLFSRQAQRLLRPASTMKLLTTAAVCRRDPDGALQTTLSADSLPEGVVTLTGGGDPMLSAADLGKLVSALHKRGLRRVRGGRIRVVDPLAGAARFGQGWMWDDEPATFMPAISAAAIDGGCVTVEAWADATGLAAKLRPVSGDMKLRLRPGPGGMQISRGRYTTPDLVTVSGKVGAGQTERRRISVPDPARFTAWVLAAALERQGILAETPVISVEPTHPNPRDTEHLVHLRRPLAEIIEYTNKTSDNLGAELLLRWLATSAAEPAVPDPGTDVDGIAEIHGYLESLELDPAAYRIADGSGVSHYTLVSAELLVKILVERHRAGSRGREVFWRSLPVAGKDGTLARRMRGTIAAGQVRAKTGTISGVSNLAGYVATQSGRRIAFAILVQNFVGSATPWRRLQDEFCIRLVGL